jgi:hypothetical protein
MWGLVIALVIILVIVIAAYYAYTTAKGVVCRIPIVGSIVCPSAGSDPGDCSSLDKSDCCGKANTYCTDACKLNTDPDACWLSCIQERSCTESEAGCPQNYVVNVDAGEKCGDDSAGGSSCETACCKVQESYCEDNCKANTDPGACRVTCMTQRGCPASGTGSCPSYYAPNVNKGEKCGDDTTGGSSCKTACCDVQYTYCDDNCKANTDPGGCRVTCLEQRGCSPTGKCPSYYAPNVNMGEKCGDITTGGSSCKTACCDAQKDYCTQFDICWGSTDCEKQCMTQRGCTL